MKIFSTLSFFKTFIFISALIAVTCPQSTAQTVIVPSNNPDDTSDHRPFGCYWGYERTHALYLNTEIGSTGNITKVGFYLNSLDNPAASTPVVIKMKTTSSTSIVATTYATASSSAITVWSGNVTNDMLVEDDWVIIPLTTSFDYTSNNLEVFIETNYGGAGGETDYAKQFRQGNTTPDRCQVWYDDGSEPTDLGIPLEQRPNIQLTFEADCSTPIPGATLSTSNPVCNGVDFTLSMENISGGAGYSYKWQSSTDGNNYTDIPTATAATYTTNQSVAKYYQCKVTCNGSADSTSTPLFVTMQVFYYCYCESYAELDEDSKIDSLELGTISTGTDPFFCETYTDYTALSTNLTPGVPSFLHIVNGSCSGEAFNTYLSVYIDYNKNADFSATNELVYSYGPITELNGIPDITFFVPLTASSGLTGMRVVLTENEPASYCGTYTRGETEDYLVNITATAACIDTPEPGATLSTADPVCPNEPFTLSIENYQSIMGLTYQWQESADSAAWSTISGAISFTQPDSQITTTYYRCKVTCGSFSAFSIPIKIEMNPFYFCYCHSTATNDADTKIDTVKFSGITYGTSPADCEAYTDNAAAPIILPINFATPLEIVNGSCSGQFYESYVAVYIDTNQNGTYDEAELLYSFGPITGLNSIPITDITIPSGTTTGITGMRIILQEGDTVPGPCSVYEYGETEDYSVSIQIGFACIDTPIAGIANVSIDSACEVDFPLTVDLSLTDNSTGIGQTYQWQQSPDGSTWTDIPGATGTTHSISISSTTYFRNQVHCVITVASSVAGTIMKPVPVGNTFDDPIVITSLPYTHFGDNFSSNCWTSDYASDSPQASPDVYYKVTLDSVGYLIASTCSTTDLNTYLHILDEATGMNLGNNNNSGFLCLGIYASDSIYSSEENKTYLIVVEGHDTLEGTYQLDVSFVPDSVVAVPQIAGDEMISVFPNPNTGSFSLKVSLGDNANGSGTIIITNALGQQIYANEIFVTNGKIAEEISLNESIEEGLYLITLNLDDRSLNMRFVIQK